MATIVTRSGKGSPLTNAEVDDNFTNLNTELGTKLSTASLATVATTGAYSDLTGKPTNVSSFTNDSGYITSSALSPYLPLSGGVVSGLLDVSDLLVKYNSATSWTDRLVAPWEQPAEILNMTQSGFSAITFHVANKYANLFGYDENNVLKSNNNNIWHSGNLTTSNYLPLTGGTLTGGFLNINGTATLPYIDLNATGVVTGRNYRIRSGIEGIANGGFSIRDQTSGTNVLQISDA